MATLPTSQTSRFETIASRPGSAKKGFVARYFHERKERKEIEATLDQATAIKTPKGATEKVFEWTSRDDCFISGHLKCIADKCLPVIRDAAQEAGFDPEKIVSRTQPPKRPVYEEQLWTEISVPKDIAGSKDFLAALGRRAQQLKEAGSEGFLKWTPAVNSTKSSVGR
jgi:hypothetical protein